MALSQRVFLQLLLLLFICNRHGQRTGGGNGGVGRGVSGVGGGGRE